MNEETHEKAEMAKGKKRETKEILNVERDEEEKTEGTMNVN